MNTSEVHCLLERALRETRCRFLGVFSADEAPAQLSDDFASYPCAYVVNTDVSSEPGRHWVACFATSPSSPVEFFDSYGKSPSKYPNIRLPVVQRRVYHSATSFQSPNSTACGHYCVLYICLRACGLPLAFVFRLLARIAASARPGVPFPQDQFVRRFVKHLSTALPCATCCTHAHQCHLNQCCTKLCRQ